MSRILVSSETAKDFFTNLSYIGDAEYALTGRKMSGRMKTEYDDKLECEILEDFELPVSIKSIIRLIQLLAIIEEQPVVLEFKDRGIYVQQFIL